LPELDPQARRALLEVARRSIERGLAGESLRVACAGYAAALRERRASFVTLRRAGELRGCIGALEPTRALVEDVAHHAHAAAFRDPRFAPLQEVELAGLHIHVSLPGPLQRVSIASRRQLLERLRPGIDGLVLAQGARRGVFLPAVWEALPEPEEFVRQLELKAGLPPDAWSRPVECSLYQTEEWGE
jgi:AmmeMemoRadiSam system protein A